jgi:hypothetical protein
LFVTVAGEISFTNLTPASRRQDHTTSPSAVSAIRLWCHRVHRIPCPTFVTIAKRPSVLGRDGEDEGVIWVKSEPEYFCKGDWTSKPVICPVGQSADCSAPAEALQLPDRRGGFRRRRCTMRHGERDLASVTWRARFGERDLTIARLRNSQRVSSSVFRAADLCGACPLAPSSCGSGAHDPSAACW